MVFSTNLLLGVIHICLKKITKKTQKFPHFSVNRFNMEYVHPQLPEYCIRHTHNLWPMGIFNSFHHNLLHSMKSRGSYSRIRFTDRPKNCSFHIFSWNLICGKNSIQIGDHDLEDFPIRFEIAVIIFQHFFSQLFSFSLFHQKNTTLIWYSQHFFLFFISFFLLLLCLLLVIVLSSKCDTKGK